MNTGTYLLKEHFENIFSKPVLTGAPMWDEFVDPYRKILDMGNLIDH